MKASFKSLALVGLATLMTAGCGGDKNPAGPDLTTVEGVLESLQESYRRQNPGAYEDLLADDFRFYLEPNVAMDRGYPLYLTRAQDIATTTALLTSSRVEDIRIEIEHDEITAANELGRESWLRGPITDAALEVDLSPDEGEFEGTTLSIRGQTQTIYLRKGRNPGDTLPASDTADRYYIVEWYDHGSPDDFAPVPPGDDILPTVPMTWSTLKMEFLPGWSENQ
jgi:hypothetical protein